MTIYRTGSDRTHEQQYSGSFPEMPDLIGKIVDVYLEESKEASIIWDGELGLNLEKEVNKWRLDYHQ